MWFVFGKFDVHFIGEIDGVGKNDEEILTREILATFGKAKHIQEWFLSLGNFCLTVCQQE